MERLLESVGSNPTYSIPRPRHHHHHHHHASHSTHGGNTSHASHRDRDPNYSTASSRLDLSTTSVGSTLNNSTQLSPRHVPMSTSFQAPRHLLDDPSLIYRPGRRRSLSSMDNRPTVPPRSSILPRGAAPLPTSKAPGGRFHIKPRAAAARVVSVDMETQTASSMMHGSTEQSTQTDLTEDRVDAVANRLTKFEPLAIVLCGNDVEQRNRERAHRLNHYEDLKLSYAKHISMPLATRLSDTELQVDQLQWELAEERERTAVLRLRLDQRDDDYDDRLMDHQAGEDKIKVLSHQIKDAWRRVHRLNFEKLYLLARMRESDISQAQMENKYNALRTQMGLDWAAQEVVRQDHQAALDRLQREVDGARDDVSRVKLSAKAEADAIMDLWLDDKRRLQAQLEEARVLLREEREKHLRNGSAGGGGSALSGAQHHHHAKTSERERSPPHVHVHAHTHVHAPAPPPAPPPAPRPVLPDPLLRRDLVLRPSTAPAPAPAPPVPAPSPVPPIDLRVAKDKDALSVPSRSRSGTSESSNSRDAESTGSARREKFDELSPGPETARSRTPGVGWEERIERERKARMKKSKELAKQQSSDSKNIPYYLWWQRKD